MANQSNALVTTGRRKTASARVRLLPNGSGKITVNDKDAEVYLYDASLQSIATAPLRTVETEEKFDVFVRVAGGGPFGQAVAISHGLARALEKHNPEWRAALKKAGLLTRDPRERERKKSGQPGARKRFQFSKR
ncbi:MAG: 30S ribosomal protein S9 [Opitutales bacterium]|nr:30S ribosomal protein S9 [Opitutales bacterium]